jgi:ABC-type nitrate/sulfonate/bicarbonate transport system substrate-binding protein
MALQRFFLVCVVVLTFPLFDRPSLAQPLKVGMTSKTLLYLPFYVGQRKGFYSAENLRVELILIGRTDVHLQALLSGEIHFGTLNADSVIESMRKPAILRSLPESITLRHTFSSAGKTTKRSKI